MSLTSIAVLLTCYNRKEKTIRSIELVYEAQRILDDIDVTIYMTDDGSTDGTANAISERFPKVKIFEGTGSMFWAGGMRNSWRHALQSSYDSYLLLNDDTDMFPEALNMLLSTHDHCIKKYGKSGIYIGSTYDKKTKKLSYGGARLTNKFWFKYHFIEPNNKITDCDLGNANIMLVTKEVVDRIGMLDEDYVHGVADYDYTLRARKNDIPVLIVPKYCGTCTDDHHDIYKDYHEKPLKERYDILMNPVGLDFKSNFALQKKHFPLRVPFFAASAALKVLFPSIYKLRIKANSNNLT